MKTIADLHIHSRFSRACSESLNIENLERYAKLKGLNLLGTGDFTHPLWLKELKEKLTDNGSGILKTGSGFSFLLSSEIANIFTQDGKGRRIHNVLLAPGFEVVGQINEALSKRGRLDYDGRPIFGFSCIELVEMMKGISSDIEIIPAHCMTPWFGVFGSASGFDSLKECFKEKAKEIKAVETGMSASPEMLYHLSFLNEKTTISFSDSHSFWPWRIGREATIFSEVRSYKDIINQIRENKILGTIETDPAYGKYHWDGHRACNFSCPPEQSKKLKGLCPVCGRPLTIGVEYRVNQLTDQAIEKNPNRKPFHKLLPLHEAISAATGSGPASKKTWQTYNLLIERFGSELNILLEASAEDMKKVVDEKIAELIVSLREGKVRIQPGYDGVYGFPVFGNSEPKKPLEKKGDRQRSLSDF